MVQRVLGWLAVLVVVGFGAPLSGCSVVGAARSSHDPMDGVVVVGAERTDVEKSLGAATEWRPTGGQQAGVARYQFMTPDREGAPRAVLHGTMDVLTLGIWEVVGTPVEVGGAALRYKTVALVRYGPDGKVISWTSLSTTDGKVDPPEPPAAPVPGTPGAPAAPSGSAPPPAAQNNAPTWSAGTRIGG